jgi:hypothetical protein
MAANSLGTTGNWGIPTDQAGLILYELSYDFSQQDKSVLDKSGEITGLTFYQSKVEMKMSGLIPKTAPFSGKIGSPLVLANAIPAHLPSSGGTTILTQLSRSLSNEDFEKIDLTAVHYPFVATGA